MTDHAKRINRKRNFLKRLLKRVHDYKFFRSLNQGILESWDKSARTL